MKFRSIGLVMVAAALAACATSGTQVLPTYTLADGTQLQDVVTIAADKTGSAPVVTHTKTFKLGRNGPEIVAQASGSAPGMTSVVIGAAVGGAVGGATAGIVGHALRGSSRSSSEALACSQMTEAVRMTIQRCICEISTFNPGCENAGGGGGNPTPDPDLE